MIHVNLITQNVCLAAYASTAIVDGREKFSSIFIDFANLSAVSVDGMEKFSLNLIDFVCPKAVIVNKRGNLASYSSISLTCSHWHGFMRAHAFFTASL